MSTPWVFHLPQYAPLAQRVVEGLPGAQQGVVDRSHFPDGERYLRIASTVRGQHVVLLGGTVTDADTLELFDLACGLVKEGALTLSVVVPFFGYATMERQVRAGEVVTAKARARLLSAIPSAPMGNRVALLDLHADGITYYFEGGLVPTHLYAKAVVLKAIAQQGGTQGYVLGSVDAGRAKWVESLANELGVPVAFILKRRQSGHQTQVMAMSGSVSGAQVVIYDDMIRTGSSLLGAARAYKDAGATQIHAVCTHGVFPGDSLANLKASGLLASVTCTDSHPVALAHTPDGFLHVQSCAPVLVDYLAAVAG